MKEAACGAGPRTVTPAALLCVRLNSRRPAPTALAITPTIAFASTLATILAVTIAAALADCTLAAALAANIALALTNVLATTTTNTTATTTLAEATPPWSRYDAKFWSRDFGELCTLGE